jgi:hypothetical protein
MRKLLIAAGACLAISLAASEAQAGIYTDDLARCIVKASSPQDRRDFVIFVFAAMSAHPDVQQYSKMTEAERDEYARKTSKLMERLLIVDCRKEAVIAIKYEREQSLSKAFSVLGETAMVDLMSNPQVEKVFNRLAEAFDATSWDKLTEETK